MAGFLTVLGPFLAGKRFILGVKRALSAQKRPPFFNNPGITVSVTRVLAGHASQQWYGEACTGREATYPHTQGGIWKGRYTHHGTPALYEGWAYIHSFVNQCVSHNRPEQGLGSISVFCL